MVGPARAGGFVYALDLERMTRFYEAMFAMHRLHDDAEHVVLQSADLQLVVHAIPAPYAAQITLSQPPEPREDQALKLFFSVPSLAQARSVAAAHGGSVDPRIWQGPGFDAANAIDPEGNILQVREWRS